MLNNPDHFEKSCAWIGQVIETKLVEYFPDERVSFIVVFKDLGSSGFSLSISNTKGDKVEEMFIATLHETREVAPKPLSQIISNPFDSLAKNPREEGEN